MGRCRPAADLVPDAYVLGLADEPPADERGDQRDRDQVDQARIDVPRGGEQARRDEWQEPAEPAVADVVRDRQRGVPDPSREVLDEERRDRPVDHRHEHHLDPDERDQQRDVRIRADEGRGDGRVDLRIRDWVRGREHQVVDGVIGKGGDQTAARMIGFLPTLSNKRPKKMKNGVASTIAVLTMK